MIKITVTSEIVDDKRQTDLQMEMKGTGAEIACEAASVIKRIPEQLKETDPQLYIAFITNLMGASLFDFEEDADEEDEDNAGSMES